MVLWLLRSSRPFRTADLQVSSPSNTLTVLLLGVVECRPNLYFAEKFVDAIVIFSVGINIDLLDGDKVELIFFIDTGDGVDVLGVWDIGRIHYVILLSALIMTNADTGEITFLLVAWRLSDKVNKGVEIKGRVDGLDDDDDVG
jgi:hypothetical protein